MGRQAVGLCVQDAGWDGAGAWRPEVDSVDVLFRAAVGATECSRWSSAAAEVVFESCRPHRHGDTRCPDRRPRSAPAERERVRSKVRSGYETGAQQDWDELLGGVEPQVSLGEGGLLEAAGASSYVAVEPTEPLRSTADRR